MSKDFTKLLRQALLRVHLFIINNNCILRIQNMKNKHIKLDHVGKILFEEFMEPYKLSQNALAKTIGVAPSRITDIVNGRRGITVDTDLRLTRLFGLSEGYFLRLQEHIDAYKAMAADTEREREAEEWCNASFEQSIEDNAEKFVPLSDTERTEVETIISAANKHGFIRKEFYHEPHEQGANQEG